MKIARSIRRGVGVSLVGLFAACGSTPNAPAPFGPPRVTRAEAVPASSSEIPVAEVRAALLARLAQGDADGARREMERLPAAERDAALRRRFDEMVLFSPQMAANWFETLPLPDRREEMVDRLAREWLLNNPAAGEAWMDQQNVPPARREQLLRDAGLTLPQFPPP